MLGSKKLILIAFIFLIIILAIFLFFKRKGGAQIKPLDLEEINEPAIKTALTEQKFAFGSKLSKDKIVIPKSLPVYKLDATHLSFDESRAIAKSLEFLGEPTKLEDINYGTVYFWFEEAKLRIIPSLRVIDYTTNVSAEDKTAPFPSDERLKETAQDFLVEKGLVGANSISFLEFRFLEEIVDELILTNKNSASLVDVTFNEKVEGYPIVNSIGLGNTISIKINRGGDIHSVYVDKLSIESTGSEYPLKSFEELESNLGKAKILIMDFGKIEADIISSQEIKRVVFENVEIAYLQEFLPKQTLLQPIFVFEAVAELVDGRSVLTKLYLPALSENYLKTR